MGRSNKSKKTEDDQVKQEEGEGKAQVKKEEGEGKAQVKKEEGEGKKKHKKATYLRDARALTLAKNKKKTVIPIPTLRRLIDAMTQHPRIVSNPSGKKIRWSHDALEALGQSSEMDYAILGANAVDNIPEKQGKKRSRRTLQQRDVEAAWKKEIRNDPSTFDPKDIASIMPNPEYIPHEPESGRKNKSANLTAGGAIAVH